MEYHIGDRVIWRGAAHIVVGVGVRFNEPWLRIRQAWNDAALPRWVPVKHVRKAIEAQP